jgi:hypothetical protein
MLGLFKRRKDAIEAQGAPESGQSAEALVTSDLPEALKETGSDSKIDREAGVARNGNAAEPVVKSDPPKALNVTGSNYKIDRETVVALNVKVVCELAGLLPDKAKYEVFRDQAIGMALSIQNGIYREFAVDHVAGLCRRCGDAKDLLDRVTDESLRERILKTCPELRHPVWSPPTLIECKRIR